MLEWAWSNKLWFMAFRQKACRFAGASDKGLLT